MPTNKDVDLNQDLHTHLVKLMFSSWMLATLLLPHMWRDLVDQTLKNKQDCYLIVGRDWSSISKTECIRPQQTSCFKVKNKCGILQRKRGMFWGNLFCFHWNYEDSACVLAAYVMLQAWWGIWYCVWLTFNLHCSRVASCISVFKCSTEAELRKHIPAAHTWHFCIFKLVKDVKPGNILHAYLLYFYILHYHCHHLMHS